MLTKQSMDFQKRIIDIQGFREAEQNVKDSIVKKMEEQMKNNNERMRAIKNIIQIPRLYEQCRK